jgi:hypothetical protein
MASNEMSLMSGSQFFIANCHKWIYGPQETGIIAATREAWQQVNLVIPSFTDVMDIVIAEEERPEEMDRKQMTPGDFHLLEYRWAWLMPSIINMEEEIDMALDIIHSLKQ